MVVVLVESVRAAARAETGTPAATQAVRARCCDSGGVEYSPAGMIEGKGKEGAVAAAVPATEKAVCACSVAWTS